MTERQQRNEHELFETKTIRSWITEDFNESEIKRGTEKAKKLERKREKHREERESKKKIGIQK
jgi:hypothetical protein